MSRYEELAGRLETMIDDLDELALDELREALADGAIQRPRSDKQLTQARRAVEKAARVLRALTEDAETTDR